MGLCRLFFFYFIFYRGDSDAFHRRELFRSKISPVRSYRNRHALVSSRNGLRFSIGSFAGFAVAFCPLLYYLFKIFFVLTIVKRVIREMSEPKRQKVLTTLVESMLATEVDPEASLAGKTSTIRLMKEACQRLVCDHERATSQMLIARSKAKNKQFEMNLMKPNKEEQDTMEGAMQGSICLQQSKIDQARAAHQTHSHLRAEYEALEAKLQAIREVLQTLRCSHEKLRKNMNELIVSVQTNKDRTLEEIVSFSHAAEPAIIAHPLEYE